MKIKIKQQIPTENPPKVGEIYEITRIEREHRVRKQRNERKIYFIELDGVEVGIYEHECEIVEE